MEVVSLEDTPFTVSANYDRVLFPPRGRAGGRDGARGELALGSGAVLKGKGRQVVPRGETLVIRMPGGGGLGDPLARPPALVAEDVRLGLVSPEAATRDYCVVLRADGSLDDEATAAARQAARDA
jgi:N-methylhydantoinase B